MNAPTSKRFLSLVRCDPELVAQFFAQVSRSTTSLIVDTSDPRILKLRAEFLLKSGDLALLDEAASSRAEGSSTVVPPSEGGDQ